jgi:membrane protein implicated in regulation of membrane protease activity
MYIVVIAWLYVAVLMALAEGLSAQGTWLGASVTFLLYGLLPVSVVAYIMGSPMRRKARLKQEAEELAAQQQQQLQPPDASSHAPGAAQDSSVAPVREKP